MLHGTKDGYYFGCKCELCVKHIESIKWKILIGQNTIPSIAHGTREGRVYYGCRCIYCSDFDINSIKLSTSTTARGEKYKEIRISSPRQPKERVCTIPDGEHGSESLYIDGCRCAVCRREHHNYYHRTYNKKYTPTINQRIARGLRSRIGAAIRGNFKTGSSVRDLGCSIDEFRMFLESQFSPRMSWDNYGCKPGQWSIDHIRPLCTFDLTDREQFLRACHYTNMRPLWHIDNMKRPHNGKDASIAAT